jgi:hypothetical protein
MKEIMDKLNELKNAVDATALVKDTEIQKATYDKLIEAVNTLYKVAKTNKIIEMIRLLGYANDDYGARLKTLQYCLNEKMEDRVFDVLPNQLQTFQAAANATALPAELGVNIENYQRLLNAVQVSYPDESIQILEMIRLLGYEDEAYEARLKTIKYCLNEKFNNLYNKLQVWTAGVNGTNLPEKFLVSKENYETLLTTLLFNPAVHKQAFNMIRLLGYADNDYEARLKTLLYCVNEDKLAKAAELAAKDAAKDAALAAKDKAIKDKAAALATEIEGNDKFNSNVVARFILTPLAMFATTAAFSYFRDTEEQYNGRNVALLAAGVLTNSYLALKLFIKPLSTKTINFCSNVLLAGTALATGLYLFHEDSRKQMQDVLANFVKPAINNIPYIGSEMISGATSIFAGISNVVKQNVAVTAGVLGVEVMNYLSSSKTVNWLANRVKFVSYCVAGVLSFKAFEKIEENNYFDLNNLVSFDKVARIAAPAALYAFPAIGMLRNWVKETGRKSAEKKLEAVKSL